VGAHQTVELPVLYFVDPKYATDFETKGAKDVTLSYTFYRATDVKPAPTASAAAN
jgi:cytochrome c oxidase assembly protein subunit 11